MEYRICCRPAQLFISPTRLDWLLLVLPILAFGKYGISRRTGVLTNIDPGVALTILDRALNIQVTYGAVMLSFLGRCLPQFPRVSELLIGFNRGAALGNGIRGLGRYKGVFASRTGCCTRDLRLADTRS